MHLGEARMDSESGQSTTIRNELSAWKFATARWKTFARRMLRTEHIRFRGIVGGEVWERDLIVTPTFAWPEMIAAKPAYSKWSTAHFGPLTLALSPPPVIDTLGSDLG